LVDDRQATHGPVMHQCLCLLDAGGHLNDDRFEGHQIRDDELRVARPGDHRTVASEFASASWMAACRRAPVGWPVSMVTACCPLASSQLRLRPGDVNTTGVSGWMSRMFSINVRAPSASPLAQTSYTNT